MADLPPLSKLPENGVSPELVGQLEHSANWARTFGGSGTNIALRKRHNEDIEQYAGVLQQQREAAQAQILQQSKAAQSLVFGMQKLDMEARQAEARLRHEEELHPLKLKAQEAKIQADLARERAATSAFNLKNEVDLRVNSANEAFSKKVLDAIASGTKQGTPEYTDLLTTARLDNPDMESEVFDDAWKRTARSPLSPQEAIDFAVEKKKALMAADAPKTNDTELKTLERERKFYSDNLAKAEGRRLSAKDDDTKKLFDADILEYRGKRDEAESQLRSFREGKPAPGQPAAPAASPAAPAKVPLPIIGEVRGGYRFKGGWPNDKANWEKL